MTLAISSAIFNNQAYKCSDFPKIELLYKLESDDPDDIWICSYNSVNHRLNQVFAPYFLKYAGFLIIHDTHEFNFNLLDDYKGTQYFPRSFVVLSFCKSSDLVTSITDSILCYIVNNTDDDTTFELLSNSDILWVDDEIAELKKRNVSMIKMSYLLNTNLDMDESTILDNKIIGLKSFEELPSEIKNTIVGSIRNTLDCTLRTFDNEEKPFDIMLYQPSIPITLKDLYFIDLYNLGYGYIETKHRHLFISNDTYDDKPLSLRVIYQSYALVPTEFLNSLYSEESIKYIATILREGFSTVYELIEHNPTNLSCYICYEMLDGDSKSLGTCQNTEQVTKNRPKKTNSSTKGKTKTHSMSKNKYNSAKNAQNKFVNQDKIGYFNNLNQANIKIVSGLIFDGCKFDLNFDTTSGKICFIHSNENLTSSNIKINLIYKGFDYSSNNSSTKIPFGGITLPLFNLLSDNFVSIKKPLCDGYNVNRLKLLFNPLDLVDTKVLISPHIYYNQSPPWISKKTSKTSLVDGYYQYYHYLHDGINDVGWGCCYRSIQVVCSWYLLQCLTIKRVPTYQIIQELLKKNDISHNNLNIGSSTWIGTVESGYFINWYLNYNCKTLYLNDASEFRNYNVLIADHFNSQGTPIIMGAGMYAYIILGICISSLQGDVAYLIADPHYTGDDNIKTIQNKGAISWKKIDFISKVSDGRFINLCCPQLDVYDDSINR